MGNPFQFLPHPQSLPLARDRSLYLLLSQSLLRRWAMRYLFSPHFYLHFYMVLILHGILVSDSCKLLGMHY